MTPCDPLTAELLAAGPWVRTPAPLQLITVRGADAADFLQRLCSQDVQALVAGRAAPAAFLDAKGKVVATCVVARQADGFVLEVQAHQRQRLLQLLERFHFTEKLAFAALEGACTERITAAAGDGDTGVARAGAALRIAWARRGVQFERWHSALAAELPEEPGRELGDDLAECLRMGAGIVRVGVDTEATTLVLEAGLDDHCSLTKGCYTGQEIVARIHTYGHTNRALCLLHLDAGQAFQTPHTLHELEDGVAVGRAMAAVPVPGRPLRVGFGYLPADFQGAGTRLRLQDGAAVTVVARM